MKRVVSEILLSLLLLGMLTLPTVVDGDTTSASSGVRYESVVCSANADKGLSSNFIEVTILEVNASHHETYSGAAIHIYVTVEAMWDVFDFSGFWVAASYDGNLIDMEGVIVIGSGHEIMTFDFVWNTSEVEVGSYLISAMTSTSIQPYMDGYVQLLPVGNINTKQGYSTIQEAINNASKGDAIYVSSGTYYENVVVNKSVSLIGENKELTIIDGNGTYNVVTIAVSDVTFTGFTVKGGIYGIYNNPHCDRSLLHDNIITDNDNGIFLMYSINCTVSNNIVQHSYGYGGIWLYDSANNVVRQNLLTENSHGMFVTNAAAENLVYHNSFINNTQQVWIERLTNTWDDGYPSGGNYWSDYAGNDTYGGPYQNVTGSDGIVDAPYIIDEDNQDSYPLMSPYQYWIDPIPGDINRDQRVDYKDLFQLARSYGSEPGDENWNPNCDLNEDEKIDYQDLFILARHYGQEDP